MRVFFFSSRRRHTRFDCDWSSDVCSSDLAAFDTAYGEIGAGGCSSCFGRSGRSPYTDDDDAYTTRADRKSTRLNSSHSQNSYAVFCLKKKKKKNIDRAATLVSYRADKRFV